MTTNDPTPTNPAEDSALTPPELRTQRAVRFSDSEWESVKAAATRHKTSAAEFVRNATLRTVSASSDQNFGAIPPSIINLIKHTYRSVYILSTLKRDEILDSGRSEDLERIIERARQSQRELSDEPSELSTSIRP
ncbi:MAG: hypothetical protein OXQ29_26405 [Rhodospirillaceae bacterium]|nr:hypothetical protein [Rhodospirillaceae bacterium]